MTISILLQKCGQSPNYVDASMAASVSLVKVLSNWNDAAERSNFGRSFVVAVPSHHYLTISTWMHLAKANHRGRRSSSFMGELRGGRAGFIIFGNSKLKSRNL